MPQGHGAAERIKHIEMKNAVTSLALEPTTFRLVA
jgi:hypothetical protein